MAKQTLRSLRIAVVALVIGISLFTLLRMYDQDQSPLPASITGSSVAELAGASNPAPWAVALYRDEVAQYHAGIHRRALGAEILVLSIGVAIWFALGAIPTRADV